ncbi:MAG: GNAT family N-acetyltransferase [Actinobacteria bacterium]|nr:GNAT family N-acetyltransferase [Actinomycetota bacterium]MCA1721137.1 GNAT family N-acetyltransferase [Actinomycetota bacterium]
MIRLSWDDPPLDQLHELVAAVAATGGAVGWLTVPLRRDVDGWYATLERFLGAYDGDRLVGCGSWARQTYSVLVHNAEIRKVMTHPEARGRGVARQVTSALIDDARAQGVEVLTLDCRGNNHGALRMYDDLGFVVTGRRPDFIAVGDERFDQVLLHLDLREGPSGLVRHGSRREGPGVT